MTVNPAILAFGFVTPAFALAGAALVSIPIIIHLLNRRRYKIVQWAAMEYLLQAMRKNRKRVRFEQILLLLTRCALVALLGLALARPLGCGESSSLAALAGSRSAVHVLVVDNSLSMSYEQERAGGAHTHLDQAKALARQRIEKLNSGSESVILITAASPARAVLAKPGYNLDEVKSAIDRIEQSYAGTDLVGALNLAVQLAREEQKQPTKFLSVFTDFTRSSTSAASADALKQVGRDLASTFEKRITFSNLGLDKQWNYSVLDVRPEGNMVNTKIHSDFVADVKGFGPGSGTTVGWKWDEQPVGDSPTIKPDAKTDFQRQTKVRHGEGGYHVLTASLLNAEGIKADNVRSRVVEVASELRVLIVEGERGTGMLSGSGAFLDLALAPKKEMTSTGQIRSDSYVAPEVISDLELGNKVLGDYKALILTNVSLLSAAQADQIEKFVRTGGTLMVFMGEQVSADGYNTVLLPRKLLPGKLVSRKTIPSNATGLTHFSLDFKPAQPHPLLDVFRGEERSGLDTAAVYQYYAMEVAPDSRADVVLRYVSPDNKPTGDPAITVHALDKGRVVVMTTTANPDWTSLPAKPAYTALMHELLAGTINVGDRWMNLTAGRPLELPTSLRLTGAPTLLDPTKKPIPVEPFVEKDKDGSSVTVYRSKPLDRPGIYRLTVGPTAAPLPIAVNAAADEADATVMPPDAMKKALGEIDFQVYGDTFPVESMAREDGADFGWTIMLAVLALAAAECFMAMSFGHYRKNTVNKGPAALAA